MKHYVCDRCGNLWEAMRSDTCPACKSEALWEYEREHAAKLHSTLVKGKIGDEQLEDSLPDGAK